MRCFTSQFFFKLLMTIMLLIGTSSANAGLFCSDSPFGVGPDLDGDGKADYGIVDGSLIGVPAALGGYGGTVADPFPTQITIDTTCTFLNFPASNPLTATLNFQTNDDSIYLITFDNVVFTGNMACANIDHRIWFVNGSDYGTKNNCQDLFIPVEAIDKQNPPGTTTVGIGEPFTYTLNVPVLYDPATGTFLDNFGSANDLHSITITDDLNTTGADLSLVGTPTVTWLSGPNAGSPVPHTFSNVGGLLTFEINPTANPGIIIPAGDQLQIAITVVADPTNANGTQIINTARWTFGRLINIDLDGDGIPEPNFFDPLPGENGVTEPLTIGAPDLVVTKTNPDTALNLGATTTFTIDAQNTGGSDAWDVTISDVIPDTLLVGMCEVDPSSSVTAEVYAADGITSVSGPLVAGIDYQVSFTNAPFSCELSITMLSSNAVIGPTQRLRITYQSELDPSGTFPAGDGTELINVAGATQWFSADDIPGVNRIEYNRTLTDGTPGVADFQDNHTITAALSGYLFQKTVINTISGENPALTAVPGDRLSYRLRLFNFTETINNLTITDILDPAYFDLASFNMITPLPNGVVDYSFNNVTGELQLFGDGSNLNLDPVTNPQLEVEFEINLLPGLTNGTVVPNQAQAVAGVFTSASDDPFVNGIYDPDDPLDTPDSTNVTIQAPGPLQKVNPATTEYTIGEQFTYRITVPQMAVDTPLYDVRILDELTAYGADLTFVNATLVSPGSWVLTNTGTNTSVVIEDTATGIDIPANEQLIIDVTVEVANTFNNQEGNTFTNTASYTYNRSNGSNQTVGSPGSTSGNLTILEPNISSINKSVNNASPIPGDVVRYSVTLTASGGVNNSDVFDITLTDNLDLGLVYEGNPTVTVGSGVASDNIISAPDIIGDGINTAQTLTWSLGSTDASDIDIEAGTSITIEYDVRLLASVLANQSFANSAVAEWTSNDSATSGERDGSDGIGGLNDYITSAATVAVNTPPIALDKQNTQTVAVVGVPFTYRLVVPATPQSAALNDVRITDVLSTAPGADLTFVSVARVSGSQPWTPVNTGDATNLVIEDTVSGIDIPAGEQISIDINVVLTNNVSNVAGLTFTNTADYTFNQVNDDPGTQTNGLPDTTAPMTIGEPGDLTLEKSGPATIQSGVPANFTLNVHNPGTAPAYDLTITDLLPDLAQGGMCNATPDNFAAQITLEDLTPVTTLVQDTDYVVNFTPGSPNCTLTITILTASAALPGDNRLIVTYDAYLDADTLDNTSLTNIAGVTEWFSADTDGSGATGSTITYTRVLSDGTTSLLDHEDAHTVISEAPEITILKTVTNTSGLTTAAPGDTLSYEITVSNTSLIDLPDFSIVDELDALNGTAMFVPNTLNIVSVIPPMGDDINTDPDGGTYGTGVLDIRNLSLAAGDQVVITFEAELASPITSGTIVSNQAQFQAVNVATTPSDDPAINGIGDGDPTPITIVSTPVFQVQKISDDITGLPDDLQAGDTLRYTITVKNIGTEDAINASLRDLVPANTTYVANSTTLNGTPVADPSAGLSPLESGILINAPENIAPGYMRADATATTTNIATIVFDVTVNSNVLVGTIISNQGYVNANGAGSGPIVEQPSDDPDTVIVNDPTLDIVGALPLVDAQKTVEYVDNNANNFIDEGDELQYTITIINSGAVPATGVRLVDAVPVNTTYLENTVYLNGNPIGQPDLGVSPLVAGIDISSDDQPLPTPGNGYLSPGGVATVTFSVIVDAGVPGGTVISNQGVVSNNELPDEPTDADGDDSNGDQPTLSVVGFVQQLSIIKQVAVVGGGPALAGSALEYTVTVTNVGQIAATDVVITDDLSLPVAGQKSFIIGSATMNGSITDVSYLAPVITADYSNNYGDLQPGETVTLRFRALLDGALLDGTTVTNIANVYWDDPNPADAQTAQASVSIDVGAIPGFGSLSGQAWHDRNFDNVLDVGERLLAGWTVELRQNGNLLTSALTDASGVYQIDGVPPNYITLVPYELRFVAPGATTTTALLGYADANPLYGYTNGLQYISDIVDIAPGVVRTNLNLPIDPNGVVYDSVIRTAIAGATLTMTDIAGSVLPEECFADTAQQGQVTLVDGYYKFDIDFDQPECPPGGDYIISVTPPAGNYIAGQSTIIPASSSVATPYSVPTCTGDALPTSQCEVQAFETAPVVAIAAGAAETDYYLHFTLSDGVIPDDSQIFNNHIPLDPDLGLAVGISKITPLVNVTRGELVPYTITINNTLPAPLTDVTLTDTIPAGFKYVEGSARLDGVASEPTINGLQLNWQIPVVDVNARYTVKLLLVVGSGVQEGEYINRAQVFSSLVSGNVSEEATATVRVVPDPVFDCSDIIGKVFDDKNLNGYQDKNETGIQGVRMATARGLLVTSDKHGRFHITCAATPDEQRGSNFILKLDERTLPSGYRVTTENPRVQRLTRGKMMKFNFGATVHRVVRLDVADGVFENNSDVIRPQWLTRVDLLIKELRKAPSILRLTYLGDVESAGLVDDRLETLRDLVEDRWDTIDSYKLVIEQEIFWRSGSPAGGGGLD